MIIKSLKSLFMAALPKMNMARGVVVNCSRNKKFELSREIIKAPTMDIVKNQIKQPGGCSNTQPGKTRN